VRDCLSIQAVACFCGHGLSDAVSTATSARTDRGCCEHLKVAFLIDCTAVIYTNLMLFVLFNNCRFRLMFDSVQVTSAVDRCLCNSKALDLCIKVAADEVLWCCLCLPVAVIQLSFIRAQTGVVT
jgi:hypothetical protein